MHPLMHDRIRSGEERKSVGGHALGRRRQRDRRESKPARRMPDDAPDASARATARASISARPGSTAAGMSFSDRARRHVALASRAQNRHRLPPPLLEPDRALAGQRSAQFEIGRLRLSATTPCSKSGRPATFAVFARDADGNPLLGRDSRIFRSRFRPAKKSSRVPASDPAIPGRYAVTFSPGVQAARTRSAWSLALARRVPIQPQKREGTWHVAESREEFQARSAGRKALVALAEKSGGVSAPLSDWKSLKLPPRAETMVAQPLTLNLWQSRGLLIILGALFVARMAVPKTARACMMISADVKTAYEIDPRARCRSGSASPSAARFLKAPGRPALDRRRAAAC